VAGVPLHERRPRSLPADKIDIQPLVELIRGTTARRKVIAVELTCNASVRSMEAVVGVSSMNHVLLNQIQWASQANVRVDRAGHTDSVDANLWRPLSPRNRIVFRQAAGAALEEGLRSLHSSSALVANVFDYWSVQDATPLAQALDVDGVIGAIAFEAPVAAGSLPNQTLNLDVCLTLTDGRAIGIESKFGEWLTPRVPGTGLMRPKAADVAAGRWADLGLPKSQALAEAMHAGKRSFRYLDATQLLQHALTLAAQPGHQGFALWYLYYAWDMPQAQQHAHELDVFTRDAGVELGFRALTYQSMFEALKQASGRRHADYIAYLQRRYFAD
jgi:hypothetical protein